MSEINFTSPPQGDIIEIGIEVVKFGTSSHAQM
jgi:acyl-CoA hydrolase